MKTSTKKAQPEPEITKKSFHEEIAEKLINMLEKGTAPFQKPWSLEGLGEQMPYNASTGNRYKGVNVLSLIMQSAVRGYLDPRWLTYKQAQAEGYQVRKGEKATSIIFFKPKTEISPKTEGDDPTFSKMITSRAFVFNAAQIDGLPPLIIEKKPLNWDPSERIEKLISNTGANISHCVSDRAFYRLNTDSIHMPLPAQFERKEKYYATMLHELSHWTGHKSRLSREFGAKGSEIYAREELRAEIGSYILGLHLEVGHDPGAHATYVDYWIKILKNDPKEVYHAAAAAEKIFNFIAQFEGVPVEAD